VAAGRSAIVWPASARPIIVSPAIVSPATARPAIVWPVIAGVTIPVIGV
jgi:hypothetical protein